MDTREGLRGVWTLGSESRSNGESKIQHVFCPLNPRPRSPSVQAGEKVSMVFFEKLFFLFSLSGLDFTRL